MTVEDRLPDQFSRNLLAGSLMVAIDRNNPVRLHLAAAGLRELFRHILHADAPDDEVRACVWFKQEQNTQTVTRRQKAIYATQGGLSDEFVEQLGLDVGNLHRAAILSIEALNKATHVRPDTLVNDELIINSFIDEALASLEGLLVSSSEGRSVVKKALADDVYRAISSVLIERTFDDIATLASKGYEIDPWIDDAEIEVEALRSQVIVVRFSGVAHVTLHYGSKHDAAEIQHDFPFWLRFETPVEKPTELTLVAHHFDDTSWYS